MFLKYGNLRISGLLRACLVCVEVVSFSYFYFYFLYSFSILKSCTNFLFPSFFFVWYHFLLCLPLHFFFFLWQPPTKREREVSNNGTHRFDFFTKMPLYSFSRKWNTQKSYIYFLYSNPIFLILKMKTEYKYKVKQVF